jgi:hypothetical protein
MRIFGKESSSGGVGERGGEADMMVGAKAYFVSEDFCVIRYGMYGMPTIT